MYRYLFSFIFLISNLVIAQEHNDTELLVTIASRSFSKQDFTLPKKLTQQDAEDKALRQDLFRFSQINAFTMRVLIEDYAKRENIIANPEHVAGFKKAYAASGLSQQKLTSLSEFNALRFQVDKHLYAKYAGRVVFDQGHPSMPIDAYRKVLLAYRDDGQLTFFDDKYQALFWQGFERPDAIILSPEDVDFSTPWWMHVAAE